MPKVSSRKERTFWGYRFLWLWENNFYDDDEKRTHAEMAYFPHLFSLDYRPLKTEIEFDMERGECI